MARKRKSKRPSRKVAPAAKKVLFSPRRISILIVALILATGLFIVRNYFLNSPDFIIKEVELRGENVPGSYLADELSRMAVDENMFAVNLKDIESSVKRDYFEIKDIHVKRIFPNKMVFFIERRKAIALLSSKQYYSVDDEGMILKDVSKNRRERLPVIKGIHVREKDIGKRLISPAWGKAQKLLEELSKTGIAESYDISQIDVANSRNLYFYIDDGLQIKIGGEDFKKRLRNLKRVLSDPEIDSSDIRYIDLRFKDIVIGPK